MLPLLVLALACGESGTELQAGVPLPDFLGLDCARDLGGVGARLRVSGHTVACPLQIDHAAGLVVGECAEVSTGVERRVALEYYVILDGVLVVLAQQSGSIDLTNAQDERVPLIIEPAVASRRCLGGLSPTEIDFTVCDNDGDGMENLLEYCHAAREPLIAERSGEP